MDYVRFWADRRVNSSGNVFVRFVAVIGVLERCLWPTRNHPHDIAATLHCGAHQRLSRLTRATHAAGFHISNSRDMIGREDVGRYNALDKFAGALNLGDVDTANGIVVITSRSPSRWCPLRSGRLS
jgi:formate dehydrogenase accessory protein FdhD